MTAGSSSERMTAALAAHGMADRVVQMAATTRSAAEAAAAIGCGISQIAKSLVFRTRQGGQPVLVVACGSNRVDEARLAALLGEPVQRPDATFVRDATGYAIGGVPPFAHARPLRTLIDRDLLALDPIWAAAGTPFAVFRVSPDELLTLTGGEVADLKQT
jgi:prolyl-tRNA editing enzyme YbaK/EbsC (Cys-tRNA(Pro) deacylase)